MTDSDIKPTNPRFQDLTGKRFGRLIVLGYSHKRNSHFYSLCRCDCGTERVISNSNIKSGHAISCGCFRKDATKIRSLTHGCTSGRLTTEYHSWTRMKSRCININNIYYKNYGGRGIKICDSWMKFENFLADMGNKPTPKHSIDRIDNDGNYEPENCRWANMKEQQRNRSNNRIIEFYGRSMTLPEWAEEKSIKYSTLYMRLYGYGWSIERAFNE